MSTMKKLPPLLLECGVAGFFTFEVFKQDEDGDEIAGTRRKVAEFKNLITNTGLNCILSKEVSGRNAYGYSCSIGSGNQTPTFTDSQLQAYLVDVGNNTSGNSGKPYDLQSTGYAPDLSYSWCRMVFRFADGLAAYNNIQEVGIFASGRSGSPSRPNVLCSRALILDSGGNPTSIAIQPDETLDIYYEIRFYPPAGVTGTITLNGVSYDYDLRPIDFQDSQYSAWRTGVYSTDTLVALDTGIQGQQRWSSYYQTSVFASPNQTLYPKEQNASAIWGNVENAQAWSLKPYVDGSFTRTGTILFNLQQGNVPGGVGSLFFSCGLGGYKLTFTSGKVPKTNQLKWSQGIIFTVARR